jgi:hypothetical protein
MSEVVSGDLVWEGGTGDGERGLPKGGFDERGVERVAVGMVGGGIKGLTAGPVGEGELKRGDVLTRIKGKIVLEEAEVSGVGLVGIDVTGTEAGKEGEVADVGANIDNDAGVRVEEGKGVMIGAVEEGFTEDEVVALRRTNAETETVSEGDLSGRGVNKIEIEGIELEGVRKGVKGLGEGF